MLSAAGTPSGDPWVVVPRERLRYEEQFASLKPMTGKINGDQAKSFFLQSQLPPKILAQIWGLADTDSDGRMDINEFSIACKLINLKLRGYEVPGILPPTLLASLRITPQPETPKIGSSSGSAISSLPPTPPLPMSPAAVSNTSRASITSFDKVPQLESPPSDWGIPQQAKLKYTQFFNTSDKTRCGYLTGAQARNILIQWKLPQDMMVLIWSLSDMDCDGRLGCEEFVLANYLCELASQGKSVPNKLPSDLIPPSFRRASRTTSISSQGGQLEQDPAATLLQSSFEDKRKENYAKGQAELERRRRVLQDQQRKEAEERERKEREEIERREKAQQEAERKRIEELEQQMREQQEQERLKEEERRRQAEQREVARREMERQRQVEWEKQRLLELQQQRQREQETVLKLKAKNQALTIELASLNDHVRDLSQKICDTRMGVSNVKNTIDGMRSTRDSYMQEQNQLKHKLKEQNSKLLAMSQEKVKLDSKHKSSHIVNETDQINAPLDNREAKIKTLKEKINDMQTQIDEKSTDIETNNQNLSDLKEEMNGLLSDCESLYNTYEQKRDVILELKNEAKTMDYSAAWPEDSKWSVDEEDKWKKKEEETPANMVKYRAVYSFTARNHDELSFQPGDIIYVPIKQTGEEDWLFGEKDTSSGWFPISYVEPVDGVGVRDMKQTENEQIIKPPSEVEPIANESENIAEEQTTNIEDSTNDGELYIANYPFQSQEAGDLCFNAGEVITVLSASGDWWSGKIGNNIGIFPSNYVQKADVSSSSKPIVSESTVLSTINTVTVESNNQIDNEVSQITSAKITEKQSDISGGNAQAVKAKKPEIASVIAAYEATSTEQLSLARGQLIMIRKKTDSGWWEGELQAKGRKRQVGWFPASYVKVLNSSGRISGRTTPVSSTRMQQEIVIDKVVALFSYKAVNPDELNFEKDDIISVTARDEEAWWKGELNGTVGLFPSNYVTPLQHQYVNTKKRQEYIRELIQTEKAYVDDLSIAHEVFEVPLRKSGIISKELTDRIFVNWQELLSCNRSFLSSLRKWERNGSDQIGHIIGRHIQNLAAYETFCSSQLESTALLQKLTETNCSFRDLMKRCQNNVAVKGMPLSSFLIKPMQRITRYRLLIEKIIENTSEDHPDYGPLRYTLKNTENFLNDINENVKIKENRERYEWLQKNVQNELNIIFNSETNKLGPRKLLYYGVLIKLKSGKELIGFLFNDFFLMIQPSKSVGKQFTFQKNSNLTYKMYKQPILIQNLLLGRETNETLEGSDSNNVLKLQDMKTKYVITLVPPTFMEWTSWTRKLEDAIKLSAKVHRSIKCHPQIKPQGGPSIGRLLVHVQRCKRLISSSVNSVDKIHCKVTLGDQNQQTTPGKEGVLNGNATINGNTQSPTIVWNCSMQFHLRSVTNGILSFVVVAIHPFSPDEFLGCAEVKIADIFLESRKYNGPLTKKLELQQVQSGDLMVKLDFHLFNN